MSSSKMKSILLFLVFVYILEIVRADVACPGGSCPDKCCVRYIDEKPQHYCCFGSNIIVPHGGSGWWAQNYATFIGCLIAGIVISAILSIACCLCLPCCYLFKQRQSGEPLFDGFPVANIFVNYPTRRPEMMMSHQPPPYYSDITSQSSSGPSKYVMSSDVSSQTAKNVRFDQKTESDVEGQPTKSCLKKPLSPPRGVHLQQLDKDKYMQYRSSGPNPF